MTYSITFRPMLEDDLEFSYQVYASTRQDELSVTGWTDDEKESFLRMQFQAQHTHYQQHFSAGKFELVEVDGEPAGRLYQWRKSDEHRIIDIALLPNFRNRGIGRRIMGDILRDAGDANLPVLIHVEHNNPAMNLYLRLGFKKLEDVGVYHLMRWSPPK